MSRGQPRAEAQPHDDVAAVGAISLPQPPEDPWEKLPRWQEDETRVVAAAVDDSEELSLAEYRESREPQRTAPTLIAGLVALLALSWLGAAGWVFSTGPLPQTPLAIMNAVALISTPLILLGIAWLILGHSPRRETERFTRAVERMRSESEALEAVLESVGSRIEENQQRLSQETTKLMALGEEATDRLGRVTHYLSKEGKNLDRQTEALEAAASNAKVDIGVLLHDLPRAEEQARGVATAMREAGLTAHEQAGALESRLTALTARGREADEVVGGAAQRLGAHLARIESTTSAATEQLDEATIGMTAAIDGAMARAAEAIGQARASLDAQGSAMLATVEQSRAALSEAGDEAARSLSQRIERIGVKIEGLAGQIATQDEASKALIARLGAGLADLDTKFGTLRETGEGHAGQLSEAFAQLRSLSETLVSELGGGQERSTALLGQMEALSQSLTATTGQLQEQLPTALARVEEQAGRTRAAAIGIAPEVSAIEVSADAAAARLSATEASVTRQREALDALTARLDQELGGIETRLATLGDSGASGADRLRDSFATLGSSAQDLLRDLGGGEERTTGLADRMQALTRTLAGFTEQLDGPIPQALSGIEEQARRTHAATQEIAPAVTAIESSAAAASARLSEAEASVTRQRESVEALLARLSEGTASAEEQLRGLGAAAAEAQETAARLARETGPELIDALLRVRETAAQASERAREAISQAIPESAAALAEASREAMADAVTSQVEQQMAEVVRVTEAAVETARSASERLTRQLLTIGETASAIEQRIDDARRDQEDRESETLSHHVALITESLNSTAIDVTKILSNEVTDSAWAAYLKGDRGIFTRRAVKLLSGSEARDILRHYEDEPDFREHVNRYIHDFEGMMRRVLADRDGSPLGVTILSSDMGKLYVALAQSIERLRK